MFAMSSSMVKPRPVDVVAVVEAVLFVLDRVSDVSEDNMAARDTEVDASICEFETGAIALLSATNTG